MTVRATRRKGYAHSLTARDHVLIADEPEAQGGSDTGPAPQELLALSLASCTAITVEMYADRNGLDLGRVVVDVDFEIGKKGEPSHFEVVLRLPDDLSDEQAEKIKAIAAKCPVHRTLVGSVTVEDRVERSARSAANGA